MFWLVNILDWKMDTWSHHDMTIMAASILFPLSIYYLLWSRSNIWEAFCSRLVFSERLVHSESEIVFVFFYHEITYMEIPLFFTSPLGLANMKLVNGKEKREP